MGITNTEHAPAAGIALGLVVNTWDIRTVLFVMGAVVFIVVVKTLLADYLIDLM